MTKINITKIISLLVIIIGFAGVIYLISKNFAKQCSSGMEYNKTHKKCVPICHVGTIYYPSADECLPCKPGRTLRDGKCETACQDDEIHCEGTCWPMLAYDCVNNKRCPIDEKCHRKYTDANGKEQCCANCVGKDDKGKDQCCVEGTYVDPASGKCTKCVSGESCKDGSCCAPNQTCCGQGLAPENQNCCDADEKCDQYGTCCAPELRHMDSSGKPVCCPSGVDFSDKDGCCAAGEILSNGECAKKCGNEICYPHRKTPTECQKVISLSDGVKYQGCSDPVTCQEKVEFHPNPPNMWTSDTDLNAGVPVGKDHQGKYWYCKGEQELSGLSRDVSTTFKNPAGCSTWNCWDKVEAVTGSHSPTYNKDTGLCKASINCAVNDKTSTPCDQYILPRGIVDDSAICKNPSGKRTGQICPKGSECNSTGDCISGYNKIDTDNELSCVPVYSPKLGTYRTRQDCLGAIKNNPCEPGFVRAGYNINKLGCYRKPIEPGHNPGYAKDADCGNGMKTDQVSSYQTSHGFCIDRYKVPFGAYYCFGDTGDRSNPSPLMSYQKCKHKGGCQMNQTENPQPDGKVGMRYSFNNDNMDSSVGFCKFPPIK
jgi:hypothetical protein